MSFAEPLLRSVLFVPAANARALAKSATLPIDALIFDLEDSAAEAEKGAARERLRAHLKATAPGPLRIVRINPLAGPEGTEDLLMARACGVDAVLLPKVDAPETLAEASDALTETDAPLSLKLWAMIETPKGVRDVEAISRVRLRHHLGALVLGPNDLVAQADLRLSPGRPELMPWLWPVLVAGRAAGVPVLDGVFNDLSDAPGLAAECEQARNFGFSGKTLIHPSQVPVAEAAFSPSPDEIADARAIVAAFADPAAEGRGVIRMGSRMMERLHLAKAEARLAHADAIAARTGTPDRSHPNRRTERIVTLYRLLTGVDDAAFCHKVSLALSRGWQLAGSPAYAFDAVEGVMKCAQPVTKVVDGVDYDPAMKLGEQ